MIKKDKPRLHEAYCSILDVYHAICLVSVEYNESEEAKEIFQKINNEIDKIQILILENENKAKEKFSESSRPDYKEKKR